MNGVGQTTVLDPLTYERPAPSLSLQRSTDRTLCMFVIRDRRVTTIDAWEICTRGVLSEWPAGCRCLLLHDFCARGVSAFGVDVLGRFEGLYSFRPELKRQVAVVLPRERSIDLLIELDIKIRELAAPYGYPVHWKVFTQRPAALNWLTHQ